METKENNKEKNKILIHPAELKRRRDELIDMVIYNEEVKKKVIPFPQNKK
jgi:hypothetical protein